MTFSKDRSYAFVMSPRLGDSLLSMVVVHNLVRAGYRIQVFSDQLHALRHWFPGHGIASAAALTDATATTTLAAFDTVLHAYHADKRVAPGDAHRGLVVMDDWPVFRQVRNMVDIQVAACKERFDIRDAVRDNGMVVPSYLRVRADMRRVVIHPVASDQQKSWLPQRFLRLAQRLSAQGFEPEFLLPPEALPQWCALREQGQRVCAYPTLDRVAERIATAGWVIGNDSGIGHLASNAGVPAVSLAMRPRIAKRWQPGWAPSRVVLAPPLVPGRYLKERSWKYLVSTSRVLREFVALRRQCGEAANARTPAAKKAVTDIRHAS